MSQSVKMVTAIAVQPDLWACNTLPGGILERWLCGDGCEVQAGDPVAAIRIEDSLHELLAPSRGRLHTELRANSMVQPGTVIGSVVRQIGPH